MKKGSYEQAKKYITELNKIENNLTKLRRYQERIGQTEVMFSVTRYDWTVLPHAVTDRMIVVAIEAIEMRKALLEARLEAL